MTNDHFLKLHLYAQLDKGKLNPVKDLKLLPFRITSSIIYGALTPELEQLENIIPLREKLFRRVISGGVTRFWWSQYLPISVVGDLKFFKGS